MSPHTPDNATPAAEKSFEQAHQSGLDLLPQQLPIARIEPMVLEPSFVANLSAMSKLASLVPSLRVLIGLSIAALVIVGLYFGRELLIPLALATLLGFLLNPAVVWLKHWSVPRMAAVLVVITIALGALVAGTSYLGMQLSSLSQELPTYQSTIRSKMQNIKAYSQGPSVWDGALSTFSMVRQTISGKADTPVPTQLPSNKDQNTAKTTNKTKTAEANTLDATDQQVQQVQVVPPSDSAVNEAMTWLAAIADPIATAGIVLLFVILILLDRGDLRDRILRILGGNLNIATDAMDEAAERIGTYLRMQLIVNVTYGVPMALGLWLIGVPAAILWGVVAVVMRFVPYVGPMLSSVFPLALAFAVDPGWDMVLWTLGLIVTLELISNNIVEPWLYGSSTGLSTLSIILAATFWTSIWGPIGLILSTPLTACLLVLARYVPSLKFIEVLIGSAPVLDAPERFYQRLLAGDVEEALELATDSIEKDLPSKPEPEVLARKITLFYDTVAIPAMRMFSTFHNNIATAEHRLRMNSGLQQFVQEMNDDFPSTLLPTDAGLRVHCIGARWEVDSKAAAMLAHSLRLNGLQAAVTTQPALLNLDAIDQASWQDVDVVCLSTFNPTPLAQVRLICRHIKRRWPHMHIIVAVWNANAATLNDTMKERFGVTAVVDSLNELVLRMELLQPHETPQANAAQSLPNNEAERVQALHASGVMNHDNLPLYQEHIAQARNAFDAKYAQISWVDSDWVATPASPLRDKAVAAADAGLRRDESVCTYLVYQDSDLVITDINRDPRFADNPELSSNKIRFYAGVPLRDKKGHILGSLCIMDNEPRNISADDMAVLHEMADELMLTLHDDNKRQAALEALKPTDGVEDTAHTNPD